MKKEVIEDLFNRIVEVIACPRCRQIMEFLSSHSDPENPVCFYTLQSTLNIPPEELKTHFRELEKASLVEELIDITDPRTPSDPNFCFYHLTTLGKITVRTLEEFKKELFELFLLL